MHILFYVTGHGFGHATRCTAVIEALPENVQVSLRTVAPQRLFAEGLARPFTRDEVELDIGMVQRDALRVDVAQTLHRFNRLWQQRERLVDQEAAWIDAQQVDIVLSDIPALGVLAARRAGRLALALTNFSWDWIYRELAAGEPAFGPLADALGEAYAQTDLLFQLPFAGDLRAFPRRQEIPLVCRPRRSSREATRKRHGLAAQRPCVLVSFGGFGQGGLQREYFAALPDWDFVFPGRNDVPGSLPENCHPLPQGTFYHPDLVGAVDVVLGKLGYGLVSECVAAQTPLVYVPRSDFAEHAVFEREVPDVLPLVRLAVDDFLAGRWQQALQQAAQAPPPATKLSIAGVKLVAETLLQRLQGTTTQRPDIAVN